MECPDKKNNFGIIVVLKVTNVSSRSDICMDDILECDFKSFKLVLFDIKWYMLGMNERDLDIIVIQHDNEFTMVNTRSFEPGIDHYVLPSQCKHVFYS